MGPLFCAEKYLLCWTLSSADCRSGVMYCFRFSEIGGRLVVLKGFFGIPNPFLKILCLFLECLEEPIVFWRECLCSSLEFVQHLLGAGDKCIFFSILQDGCACIKISFFLRPSSSNCWEYRGFGWVAVPIAVAVIIDWLNCPVSFAFSKVHVVVVVDIPAKCA